MRVIKYIGLAFALLAALNFGSFAIISGYLGGSADSKLSQNGQYFLSEHGKWKQVSKSVYDYSRLHQISVFITFGIGMIGFAIFGVLTQEERERKKSARA